MTKCPYCKSTKVSKRGQKPKQRYQCVDKKHPENVSRYFYDESTGAANVLLLDIETLPMELYAWRLGTEIWNIENIKRDWCILSYATKWLFRPEHKGSILTPKEARNYDDKRIVGELHQLLTQADIVIAHNGRAFDMGKINARFLAHDMAPPAPYRVVDTCLTARHHFGLTSNSLDYLAQYLKLGSKHHTDFDLWIRCAAGEQAALDYMFAYNCKDVYLLEDVYVKLRPYIKHPNMAMYVDTKKGEHVCGKCQSEDIDYIGSYYTDASVFDSYQCNNCGAWTRHQKRKRTVDSRVI